MAALYQLENFENNRVPIKIYNHKQDGEKIYTPLHWHRNIEFNLATVGRVMSYVNGEKIIKNAGEWNVINTTVIHSDHYVEKTDHFEGITVQISKSFLDKWLGENLVFQVPKRPEDRERIREILLQFGAIERQCNIEAGFSSGMDERLNYANWNLNERKKQHMNGADSQEVDIWSDHSSQILKLRKMELTFHFLQELERCCIADVDVTKLQSKSDAAVKDVIQYIEEHFSESITLNQVAKHFGYTPSHLSRTFKSRVGANFHDYLQNVRITHSVELLRSKPNMLLLDCAMQNGFSNVKSFITEFHRTFGCTPSEWVRNGMK